jgi:hypothetical protein
MDRRSFFKTIMTSSMLTPFLLASKSHQNDLELFLISEDPERFLPEILNELKFFHKTETQTFSFLDTHPQKTYLTHALESKGWQQVNNPLSAGITLSFSHLHHIARPSFTLVENGRIIDIRSQKLRSLWDKINRSGVRSTSLTTAALNKENISGYAGAKAAVYRSGKRLGALPLNKDARTTISVPHGKITVAVKDGKARVADSCCKGKICLYSPPVWRRGERIICAPNQFFLAVEGGYGVDTVIG